MEGPREPGYYASVTGRRPPGEPRFLTGFSGRGPVSLFGQVHRYGPKGLFGRQKVERVWKGKEYPTPKVGTKEYDRVMDEAMKTAEKKAENLNLLDPEAEGI